MPEQGSPGPTELTLPERGLWRVLVLGAAVLVLLHVITGLAMHHGLLRTPLFFMLFDLREEANLPQFYSSFLMLCSAALMFIAHRALPVPSSRWGWRLPALVFLFLAADEVGQLHEKTIKITRTMLGGGDLGAFNYAWVVPYSVLVIAFAAWGIGFLRALHDRRTVVGLVVSGLVFVSGAMGVEMVEGALMHHGRDSLVMWTAYTIEESLEFTGLLLLLRTLLGHLRRNGAVIALRVKT